MNRIKFLFKIRKKARKSNRVKKKSRDNNIALALKRKENENENEEKSRDPNFALALFFTLLFSTPGRNRTGTPERTGF